MQQQQPIDLPLDQTIQRNINAAILKNEINTTNSLVFKKPIPAAVNSPTKLQKSPVTKRPNSSAVTFSGNLYKQGSDGLRVWRKRWFVLSDYCLYYYKSAEEDKQLGSILLPSYTASICLPDSKNYRKFSFKLEHKNMRPFLMASDTIEGMYKWVKILDAATHMQKLDDNGSPMENSLYGGLAISGSIGALSGYGGRNEYFAGMDGLHSDSLPDSPADGKYFILDGMLKFGLIILDLITNNWLFVFVNNTGRHKQPLYVNAPPKPRRSRNELGYWTLTPNSRFDLNSMI